MGAPCTFKVPGTVVRVVKSISDASEWVPVSFDISVDWGYSEHQAKDHSKYTDLPNGREANEAN